MFKPLQEAIFPTDGLAARLSRSCAEAMSTRGILQVEMRFAMRCQCAVHELGVAMVDNGVVFAVHKKNGAGYSVSMKLHRQ